MTNQALPHAPRRLPIGLPSIDVSAVTKTFRQNPRYLTMRALARFTSVRSVVSGVTTAHRRATASRLTIAPSPTTDQPRLDLGARTPASFAAELEDRGASFGMRLPSEWVEQLHAYAAEAPCYVDRDPELGFNPGKREAAEAILGKPILLAQYFNTMDHCPAIGQLASDPAVLEIAERYLGAQPRFVGTNLWWTYPVAALEADRMKHAHLYHRDVDDFRFFKFFFYLTDVETDDGGHVLVTGSHKKIPVFERGDRWSFRRYSDAEIESYFAPEEIIEVAGPAGVGFIENTLCIHKGQTPKRAPRLLLQLQFALFDYGTMHDRRPVSDLRLIAP